MVSLSESISNNWENEEDWTTHKKESRREGQKEADERQNQATAHTLLNKNKRNGSKKKYTATNEELSRKTVSYIHCYYFILAAVKRLLSGGINPILIISEFDPPVCYPRSYHLQGALPIFLLPYVTHGTLLGLFLRCDRLGQLLR